MKHLSAIITFLLICAFTASAQTAKVARQGARHSEPELHRLLPASGNVRMRIAVFGGSLSVRSQSDAAKQIWADELDAEVTTYGVGGAGFAISRGYSIQKQVDTAGVYDVYVLWASTNDFTKNETCGKWNTTDRDTQCGGIDYCIHRLREKNPDATIVFLTSLRFFKRDSGFNPHSKDRNKTGKTFAQYVREQIRCCRHHGVPVLNQFRIQDVDVDNYKCFYLDDKLHMNEAGYLRIAPAQVSFFKKKL